MIYSKAQIESINEWIYHLIWSSFDYLSKFDGDKKVHHQFKKKLMDRVPAYFFKKTLLWCPDSISNQSQ